MKATVIGSQGFIGSHLVRCLEEFGAELFAPRKGDPAILTRPLGHVFYCAGLTADFRQKPVETIRAHVAYLLDVLEQASYESLLYLSSTRVYAGSTEAREGQNLRVNSCDPSDLYNLSKLTGEAACLSFVNPRVRIVRLSNVYGVGMDPVNFLASLIDDAVARGSIVLGTSLQSAKDYVWVSDAVGVMSRIALSGRYRLYNVGQGRNVSNAEIISTLKQLTGCVVDVAPGAPTVTFPEISTDRIRSEFDFVGTPLDNVIDDMVAECRRSLESA